jgi:type II secretory pathway pseudopilin PulG
VRIAAAQRRACADDGFILIEVLVSALVLIIASAGVALLLQTTVHSQADERHSSEAYSLAQEDQARLSAVRIEDLLRMNETRTIKLNQTEFSVHSVGSGINDVTSAPSCGEGTYKVDYVEITSIVTWPGMTNAEKAKIVSKLSPSKGSLTPTRGSLAIQVTNQAQTAMPGVSLSGGSGAISGFTDASGCAIFPNLLEGNYSLTVSGEAAGLVNKMGESSEVATVSVVGGDTKREAFEFDRPGTIPVEFKYRVGSEENFLPSTADSVVANNTGMKNAKVFGTPGGTRLPVVEAKPLFPFNSAYTIYAGSCASSNPDPEGKGVNKAAYANVVAPAGAAATPSASLQLPAFDPTVWSGKNEANKGSALANADVWVRDAKCTVSGQPVTRRYTTNISGKLPDLGLPWGTYNVCADTEPGTKTSGVRRRRIEGIPLQNLLASTTPNFYLGSGSGTVSEEGSCP